MFARAVEWDRTRVNVVKLIAKPRVRRARAIKLLRPVDVEALRRQMLASHKHGMRDATLVSVLAYAGLRPEEALALEYRHLLGSTILIEQKWVDGEIVPGQKTTRPPQQPPSEAIVSLAAAQTPAITVRVIRLPGACGLGSSRQRDSETARMVALGCGSTGGSGRGQGAVFYARMWRSAEGVCPVSLRRTRQRWLWSAKPRSAARRARSCSPPASCSSALRVRRRMRWREMV